MKKLMLAVMLTIPLFIGCKRQTDEERDHDLITKALKERLRDPDSYKPESFGKRYFLAQGDSAYMYGLVTGKTVVPEAQQKKMTKPSKARMYLHKYGAKNGFGGMNRKETNFTILSDSLVYFDI